MKDKIRYIKSNFLKLYKKENKEKAKKSDKEWGKNSRLFRKFWKSKIMNDNIRILPKNDLREIIKKLDSHAKGKEKGAETVATTKIRMGMWYKSFRNIKGCNLLKNNLHKLFHTKNTKEQIDLLNTLEQICRDKKIKFLVSDKAIILNCLLFINDPKTNVSMVSLGDRLQLISYFNLRDISEIMNLPFGQRSIQTRDLIITLKKKFGFKNNRALDRFLYYNPIRSEWKTAQVPEKRPDYGEPIHFRGFMYAPVNHEGTVALFGAVAKDLGFNLEKIRIDYPDIEAIHNGKRVNIEIEYLNSEFNHDPKKCDIIVCWKKDTKLCPVKKVIELKEEIKRLD